MVFSSPIFLFVFLPLVTTIYYLIKQSYRNAWLLASSILFYAWGEPIYVIIMLIIIFLAYLAGMGSKFAYRKRATILFVVISLSFLFYFKYLNFFIKTINDIFMVQLSYLEIVMPIGISFFIFQSISYVIDVYRGEVNVQENPFKLALYIAFFPQLIAGPIVKYHDIERYIDKRNETFEDVIGGIKRFIIGLSKKVLLANVVGKVADDIFAAGVGNIDLATAWLGAIAYTFQIFFDFSGYSDMAIGLGRMFGFHFLENFNYPYVADSITDFWRRWHISLSTWFKEYVYIPLGGNRRGKLKTYRNLILVFLATGIWHGANWTFIFWGLWHGAFLLLEKHFGFAFTPKHAILKHFYALLVVVLGWVFFRVESLQEAFAYIKVMFGITQNSVIPFGVDYYLANKLIICLLFCALFSIPVKLPNCINKYKISLNIICNLSLLGLLFLSCMYIAGATYNPFIYFRF